MPLKPNSQKVFTQDQEKSLSLYARKSAKMFYGPHVDAFRSLAYEYAVACGSKAIPSSWKTAQKATRDWYYAYMRRHPELSLKTPEGMPKAKKKRVEVPVSDDDDADDPLPLALDDSSEYSDEVEEDPERPYPFADKFPEVGDFILVELQLQEGRSAGDNVYYVGKILALCDNGGFRVSFLRASSVFVRDTFRFPIIEDISEVEQSRCKGVLVPLRGSTQRLSNIIKISPPLQSYNMR